jgi:hypothetical protein
LLALFLIIHAAAAGDVEDVASEELPVLVAALSCMEYRDPFLLTALAGAAQGCYLVMLLVHTRVCPCMFRVDTVNSNFTEWWRHSVTVLPALHLQMAGTATVQVQRVAQLLLPSPHFSRQRLCAVVQTV